VSRKDSNREWIDRNVSVPVITHDWGASFDEIVRGNATSANLIPEWRKVQEYVRKRRGKQPTGSIMWKACEEVLGLIRMLNQQGPSLFRYGEEWMPTHTILERVATTVERKRGKIDSLVQAVLRDAMLAAYDSERFEHR